MVAEGANLLITHVGLTTADKIGAKTTMMLDYEAKRIQAMHDTAKRVRKDVLILCHGGPIAEPEDAVQVLARTSGIIGFINSSNERPPTERAVVQHFQEFKIRIGTDAGGGALKRSPALSHPRKHAGK
jgi:predicted TIM-barrel enzyme